jgi:hypothetical protein
MIDAMKKGLEAIQSCQWYSDDDNRQHKSFDEHLVSRAHEALRQAIAEAEKPPIYVERATTNYEDGWEDGFKAGAQKEKGSTPLNVDPRVLLGRNSYSTKNIENRLCDLERRMAKIETHPIKEATLQEMSDIGQDIEQEPESWMGVSDNPYCNDVDCNDPNGRAMRWHNKLLELRKQAALDGLAETSREIEQEPHPCDNGCQFAKDVGMPEQTCGGDCQYNKAMSTKPENIDTKTGCVDSVDIEPVAYKYTDKTNPLVYYFTDREDVTPNPDVIETALYTAPPKREFVGLTDEDIDDVTGEVGFGYIDVARAIEQRLKEKNI